MAEIISFSDAALMKAWFWLSDSRAWAAFAASASVLAFPLCSQAAPAVVISAEPSAAATAIQAAPNPSTANNSAVMVSPGEPPWRQLPGTATPAKLDVLLRPRARRVENAVGK